MLRFVGQHDTYTAPDHPDAEGGQAWVHKATAKKSKVVRAVKVSKDAGAAGAWMDREREALRDLLDKHPDLSDHLVELVDWGEVTLRRGEGKRAHRFLVLEWLPQTLGQWVGPRSLEERLDARALAAEGATRLHRSGRAVRGGVAHRDIKPDNFLVGHIDGRLVVKLSDFGGFKKADQPLHSWTFQGTPGFAPPDQILRQRDALDPGWDVYAMALTVFWCLTAGWDAEKQRFRGVLPASNALPTPPLTKEGQSLYGLLLQQGPDHPRVVKLSALPLAALVRLAEMSPLTDEDRALLTESIGAQLQGRVADPAGVAEDLAEELCDWLEEALQPDPARRCPDARWIQAPCRVMARRGRRLHARHGAVPAPPDGASVVLRREPVLLPAPPEQGGRELYVVQMTQRQGLRATPTSAMLRSAPAPVSYPMVWIPKGHFVMGSPRDEEGRGSDELQHEVELTQGFWMGKTQVTQGQWQAVMGSNPSWYRGSPHLPVEWISWFDAVRFCNALSALQGLEAAYWIGNGEVPEVTWIRTAGGFRLPTEAEWEYAARAGTAARFLLGDTEADLARVVWYLGNAGSEERLIGSPSLDEWIALREELWPKTHPVGQKPPNPWGLHDVLGNVWEWCWDLYSSGYYQSSPSVDPLGPSTGFGRVNRGGSWYDYPANARVANRDWWSPSNSVNFLGLRLARSR